MIGTGGYMRRVSMRHRSRYFISNVSWNVTGLSLSPKISSSSWITFSWMSGWQPITDKKKLDAAAVVSCPWEKDGIINVWNPLEIRNDKFCDTCFKHDSVNLLFDFGFREDRTILTSFHQQIEESLSLLLANVIFFHIKIVLQTSRLSEGQSLHRGVLKKYKIYT